MLCGDDPMKQQLLLEGGGFTTIYAPDGQLMHQPLAEGDEGIVYADLDLGMISLAKAAADPAGHYARPDVTRLLLDRTPGDRVVIRKRQGAEVARESDDEPAVARSRRGHRAAAGAARGLRSGAWTPPSRATCAARAAGSAAFPTTTSRPIPRSSRATRSASSGW